MFKVGDKVRLVKDYTDSGPYAGEVVVVSKVSEGGVFAGKGMAPNHKYINDNNWSLFFLETEELELVEEEVKVSKFKVGDKVRIVGGYSGSYNGRIGTITHPEGMVTSLEGMKEDSTANGEFHLCFHDHELKLVEPEEFSVVDMYDEEVRDRKVTITIDIRVNGKLVSSTDTDVWEDVYSSELGWAEEYQDEYDYHTYQFEYDEDGNLKKD